LTPCPQAANALELFNFVSADLNSYQPVVPSHQSPDSSSGFDDSFLSNEPAFPKSLYLIEPLFSSYELNPVARGAQTSIPAPEDLDLDAWIVPLPQEAPSLTAIEEAEIPEKRPKKGKKGKGKDVGSSTNGRKVKQNRNVDLLTPAESDHEEKNLLEEVWSHFLCNVLRVYCFAAEG
jgi:AP-3 complex subunit delta-1